MRLIDADALKEDFKKRLSFAHKWLEKAKEEEIKIRANAVISYICEVIMTIDYAPTICRTDKPVCIIKEKAIYITDGHINAMIEYEKQEHVKQIEKGIMKNLDDIKDIDL